MSVGNSYLVPGATVATIVMLGALHARRLYDDKKVHIMHTQMELKFLVLVLKMIR